MTIKPPERCPITVVLLNYNGGEKLERCVRSLVGQRVAPARVIFVDNGSACFDEAAILEMFGSGPGGSLEIERIAENVGYVKGMNAGLRRLLAGGTATDWVMTLSNDTELDPGFFKSLRERLSGADHALGMIAPKVRALDNPALLDATGIGLSLDGMSSARGQRERDERQYDTRTHILIPNGVAAIYRTVTLQDVGLMDESFWCYCEDTDLGLRAWLAGWDCVFVPECIVYHARSSTLGEHSLDKLYYVERNHYWVAIKNLPLPLLLLNPTFTAYRYLVQVYALLAKKGQGGGYGRGYSIAALLKTTLKGVWDAGRGVPHAFEERVKLRRLRRRSSLEVLRALWEKRMPFDKLILK